MKRAFESWMYGLTMRGDWISRVVAPIWFHFYCPYPLSKDWTARSSRPARRCVQRGECGCDNGPRIRGRP